MKLIGSVEIQRFRSCEATKLNELDDVVAIVGPNNSGKSNILRALNLFFNEETEPNSFIDFDVDFRLRPPTSKKKKSIRICVEFLLPDRFKFREGTKDAEELLGRHCWIAKVWTPLPDPFQPEFEISKDGVTFRRASADEALTITRFLNLVSFRYIPNRAIPASMIREESRGVLRELTRRHLTKGATTPVLADLSKVATNLVGPIAADLSEACVGVTGLELSTPTELSDLVGEAAFKSSMGELGNVADTSLGAGVQSLLMFHVLHLIDQGQFQGFGWKQAAVWAVEEPESSLHRELQIRLALLLRRFTLDANSRFQILSTTHNDIFVYAATSGYTAVLNESLATTVQKGPIQEVADWSTGYGVTGWSAPALKFPTDVLILVEGSHDCTVLQRAAELTGIGTHLVFRTPSQLDPTFGGDGWDRQREFIAKHAPYIAQRLPSHPLKVLLDWDRNDSQFGQVRTNYGPRAAPQQRGKDGSWVGGSSRRSGVPGHRTVLFSASRQVGGESWDCPSSHRREWCDRGSKGRTGTGEG